MRQAYPAQLATEPFLKIRLSLLSPEAVDQILLPLPLLLLLVPPAPLSLSRILSVSLFNDE